MSSEVTKLTPEQQQAWVHFDPGFEPGDRLTARQAGFVRAAFFGGWAAALASDAMVDLKTHRRAWRSALEAMMTMCFADGSEADTSYWLHEIRAFDHTFDALVGQPSTVDWHSV